MVAMRGGDVIVRPRATERGTAFLFPEAGGAKGLYALFMASPCMSLGHGPGPRSIRKDGARSRGAGLFARLRPAADMKACSR